MYVCVNSAPVCLRHSGRGGGNAALLERRPCMCGMWPRLQQALSRWRAVERGALKWNHGGNAVKHSELNSRLHFGHVADSSQRPFSKSFHFFNTPRCCATLLLPNALCEHFNPWHQPTLQVFSSSGGWLWNSLGAVDVCEACILAKDAKHPPFLSDVTVSGVDLQTRLLEDECKQDGGAQWRQRLKNKK